MRGDSGAWRVNRWRLACFSLVLGDTEDRNNGSGGWHDEWPLDSWVESAIFQWLREIFLPIIVNEPAEYPKPDKDNASRGSLLAEERNENPPHNAPPPQKAVLFCPLPVQVCYLQWWLMMFSADNVDIFHMYAEMCNDECTEMQLKIQDSQNPSVFITTLKVGGTGPKYTAASYAVITQKFWVSNEQRQAFARVLRLGHNRVPHAWLVNTGPDGYNNHASHLHQHYGVAQMRVQHGFMS